MINQPPTLPFDLSAATKHLCACDETLAELIRQHCSLPSRMEAHQSPYEALLEAIAYQSISGKAAATIFGRVKASALNGGIPTPQEMLKLRTPALRKAGLSGAKVLAMKDVAKKTIEGIVPSIEAAEKMSTRASQAPRLSRGVGAWTVEMFLIFRLGRPDVLPIHDLGVQKGWSVAYGKKHKPSPKELLVFGERGAPIAPSPAGTCGAPSNAPATPPPTKSAKKNPNARLGAQQNAPRANPLEKTWPLKLLKF